MPVCCASQLGVCCASQLGVCCASQLGRTTTTTTAPNGRTVDAKKNRFAICFGVKKPLMANGGLRRTAARSAPKKSLRDFFWRNKNL